jgi:hypothetical protein
MGLAAYYLIRDDFENGLGLPAGEYEIPVVVQDREFNSDGTFFYPPTLQDAFFGDKLLVNGKVWPFLNVARGKYRLRFLNGSQARPYTLRLENLADPAQVIPFELIGTDGGLISAPIALNTFTMAPAERFDVVVDFGGFSAGTEIVLRNDNAAQPSVPNVMKFIVGAQAGHTAALPGTLRTVSPIPENQAIVTRRFRLARVAEPCAGGEWLIQSLDDGNNVIGEHWDDITEFPILGDTEIWEFENPTNVMHPMHVHLVQFQVLSREDLSGVSLGLNAWEIDTWKDTVRVPPQSKVRIIATFDDYLGKFPYHCHILDHEDHEMMRQFQTTNDSANCNGDGICDVGEDCISCAVDCGLVSGAFCGNGLCEIGDGENFDNCSDDCAGKTKGKDPYRCGLDADCTDPRCTDGFFWRMAPRVAACCGDALCEGQEDDVTCALDCAGGGGVCEPTSNRERSGRGECEDGLDNDCDGLIDGADPDCCTATEDPEVTCDDGLDNDCDGLIDGADPDCQTPVDCSIYGDRQTCNDDPACRWKKNVCQPR